MTSYASLATFRFGEFEPLLQHLLVFQLIELNLCANQSRQFFTKSPLGEKPCWLKRAVIDHNATPSSWRRVDGVEVMILAAP